MSDARTAEFSRLFNLFEHLASGRARASTANASLEELRSMPISEDLEPLIKNLSTIVTTRKKREAVKSRSRHDTNIVTPEYGSDDEESLAKFPLAKKYPFTFKLMLHKLYEVDDWARTVKEVLEKSKMAFKTLAEQEAEMAEPVAETRDEEVVGARDGGIHFKIGTNIGGGRRGSVAVVHTRNQSGSGVRQRSQSVVAFGPRPLSTLSPASPKFAGVGAQADLRAVKKRCVGRRKSMSGLKVDSGRVVGTWVYDAAVSHSESPSAVTFAAPQPAPPPSPTKLKFYGFQSLMKGKPPGKVGSGMKRRVSVDSQDTISAMSPFQSLGNLHTGRRVARGRASTVDGPRASEVVQKKQLKRPLEA